MARFLPANEVCRFHMAAQERCTRPVSAVWRAESFRATEGLPMTLRRARALNAVLERCRLPLVPGEALLGSGIGRFAEVVDERALESACEYLAPLAGRDFTTHADHSAPDYAGLLREGLAGLQQRAKERRSEVCEAASTASGGDRAVFLDSVVEALGGLRRYVLRWAEAAEEAASSEPEWSETLLDQAEMLRRLSTNPPRTLHEAMQLVLLAHSALQLDDRYAMALGRVDQYLYPFYRADVAAKRLDEAGAQELFDHLFAKIAHRNDIQNTCVGGLTADGADATNELSYLAVRAAIRVGQPGANLTARIHAETPDRFLQLCIEAIRTGIGFPALVNDDILVPALVEQGYPLEDARVFCFVGCIETFMPGKQAPWADSRFNLLRCVDLAMRGGRDGLTGEQAGPDTGEPVTWEMFWDAFCTQVREGVRAHAEWFCAAEARADAQAAELTSPLLSALTRDCIERGLDVNDGGAVYAANYGVAGMGIGSTADALAALRQLVYREHRFTLAGMREMLDASFAGYEAERQLLLHGAPKYGNDDQEVDSLAREAALVFADAVLCHRTPRGGRFWGLMAANVQNVAAGYEVGATPDGRLARQPLSDAASPTFGRDVNGPTAVARSIAGLCYGRCPGGNVVNMKLHPSALAGERGVSAMAALVRGCFALGGAQLQFNTTDRATLMHAMEHPEEHRDLVVRVSGFSAYFVTLDRAVQEDILARTEHALPV